jgi:hypothetical protein
MREDFGTIYCREYNVASERFAKSLLHKCCHWWTRPLLKLLLLINPATFLQDLQHLESLKGAIHRSEFRQEVSSIESFNQYDLPGWRKTLRLRVSVGKLSQLSKLLDTK